MTSEHKIITSMVLITIAILIGGAFLFSRNSESSVQNDQVIVKNGLHWHPKLTITIKGEKQQIPPGIGMSGQVHQELHTHEEDAKDGVIHMEMKGLVIKDETRLGNFLRLWGKEFTSSKIFDKTNGAEGRVEFLVNGQLNYDFDNYLMKDNDIMEIRYE